MCLCVDGCVCDGSCADRGQRLNLQSFPESVPHGLSLLPLNPGDPHAGSQACAASTWPPELPSQPPCILSKELIVLVTGESVAGLKLFTSWWLSLGDLTLHTLQSAECNWCQLCALEIREKISSCGINLKTEPRHPPPSSQLWFLYLSFFKPLVTSKYSGNRETLCAFLGNSCYLLGLSHSSIHSYPAYLALM